MSTAQNSASQPVTAICFPQFPSFPLEIRQLIWQAAAVPRIVYLEKIEQPTHMCSRVWSQTQIDGPDRMGFFDLDHQPESARVGYGPLPIWGFRSRSVPVLFYVCRESYNMALSIYSRCFGTGCSAPATWFNFDLDTLYLDWGVAENRGAEPPDLPLEFSLMDLSDDVKRVQNLALHNNSLVDFDLDRILRHCGNVRSLTMVPKLIDVTDFTSLDYLDEEDGLEALDYLVEDGEEDVRLHPIIQSEHPEWESEYNNNLLWADGARLWSVWNTAFFVAERMNQHPTNPGNSSQLKWARPRLHLRPIVTPHQKFDILHRKQLFDAERQGGKMTVSLMAMNFDTLELSVPLLTTLAELIALFCQAKDIDVLKHGGTYTFEPLIHSFDDNERYSNPGHDRGLTAFSFFRTPEEKVRFCIYFRQGSPQRPHCTIWMCEQTQCPHTEEWERKIWMETGDDWGLRGMFDKPR
ncbi:hypothetical protein BKA65DRAFT_498104 [Rhexocercosporidium sp. MPI-PUGE-AT-0058]|nr:hypothetical protein BKA65DRAFT_498104 [Rhexocercosporidium sp. MPI-PUGE-AT-0058]